MADILPFHGVYYSRSFIKDPAAVICPPYDIISPRMQQELYERSQYNFVRLEYGRVLPEDKDADNKYTRAADTLAKWLETGVLEVSEKPALYLHDHYFEWGGKKYRRRGIICPVKLEEWSKMVVRPHEGTLAQPKSDRLNLLWALQANTSCILSMFEDSSGRIASLLETQSHGDPIIDIKTDSGEAHRLWAITGEEAVSGIQRGLAGRPLYIADGHHRYESALTYQRERRACSPEAKSEEPYDFTLMTLVDFADPGLVILPAHRLVRGVQKPALDGLLEKSGAFFDIKEMPLEKDDISRQLTRENGEEKILMYGPDGDHLYALRLRDPSAVSPMMPYFHSELYKRLTVSVVDHVILEELLGMNHDMAGVYLGYCHDAAEAVSKVREGEYQLTFIIDPVKPGAVKEIADSGDRMPRKSTYFYPKAPAGLVFYRFG